MSLSLIFERKENNKKRHTTDYIHFSRTIIKKYQSIVDGIFISQQI